MGIELPEGPQGGGRIVGNAFSAMTEGPAGIFDAGVSEADEPMARIFTPVPVFAVDLMDIRDAGIVSLNRAVRTGWRYLVQHPGGLTAIDLGEDEDQHPELLVGSDVAANLVRSARRAERIAGVGSTYELRILDLNMIGNSVLWLRDQSQHGKDRFVSLSRTPKELKSGALMARLRREADRKIVAMALAGRAAGGG